MTRKQFLTLPALVLTLALGISRARAQTYTDIHDFDTPLLASPQYSGILAQGRDGALYGTAPLGGDSGRGGVFRITPAGAYSVLHSFDSTLANPYGGLTLASDGNFYGTTYGGGKSLMGTVFQVTPDGIVTTLHSFAYVEGSGPYAPPIQASDGNFYGTTTTGASGYGAIYKLTPAGVLTTIHVFDSTHGSTPVAPLIQATDGNFYGTTKVGGTFGYGTAFKMTSSGALTVLYNFDSTHGATIYAPLLQGSDGNFYGTARTGGNKNNGGVLFKLTATKILTVLHNFDATTTTGDGTLPYAGLTQASDGNFYSVTSAGGANGLGTLYKITPAGAYSSLYSFASATGSLPFATLRQHTNGILYGEATSGGGVGHGALYSFDLGLGTFINVQPPLGKAGRSVGILGQGLSGTISVKFNGTIARFSPASDTYVASSVPTGATSGLVTAATPAGTLKSTQRFRVTPVISSFAPSSGVAGTSVTIQGNSFTGATKVAFGGVLATVFSVDSYTQMTVTVPAGAVTGKIQVGTAGGTASSPTAFTVN